MRDGLRELGGLLHAERVSAERAVANFAEADVEEGFVRAFQGVSAGRPESSAIRRTKRTPLMEEMKESFSGM